MGSTKVTTSIVTYCSPKQHVSLPITTTVVRLQFSQLCY